MYVTAISMTSLLNANLSFRSLFFFWEFWLGHITGASIYPRWRRGLECALLEKKSFPASIFSVTEIASYNTAKSRSKSLGKIILKFAITQCAFCTILFLLSNLSSNFVESIFCKIICKLKNHNHIHNTRANLGGKCDTSCSSKNLYFH